MTIAETNRCTLSAEGRVDKVGATESQIRKTLSAFRSQGPLSFASLTDDQGSYVQAAGGQATCLIERFDASEKRHFRGYRDKKSAVFADGSVLSFNGGQIALQADEWFLASDAAELFVAFLHGSSLPTAIKWRDVTQTLRPL